MQGDVLITQVTNYFDPRRNRIVTHAPAGRPVLDYVQLGPRCGFETVIAVDGRLIPTDQAAAMIAGPGQSIVFSLVPQGGDDDKGILGVVAQLAVIVVAGMVTFGVGSALSGSGWAFGWGMAEGVTGWAAVGAAAAGAAVGVVGGLLVTSVFSPSADLALDVSGDFAASATYGWDIGQNPATEASTCWPILYGTHRITPLVLNKYVSTDGDKQYLHVMLLVADHDIDAMPTVYINRQSSTIYTDVEAWWRSSENEDAPRYFSDTHTQTGVGGAITAGDYVSQTTSGNAVEELAVGLVLPQGLWYANNSGGLDAQTLKVRVEFLKTGEEVWVPAETYGTSSVNISTARWSAGFHPNGTGPWIELEAGSEVPGDHYEGEPYTGEPEDEWRLIRAGNGSVYGGQYVRKWRWFAEGTSVNQIAGAADGEYVQIRGAQTGSIRLVIHKSDLTAAEYTVRAKFDAGNIPPTGARYGNSIYFEYLDEILYDDFIYPGASLVEIRALATDQLSGSVPLIELVPTRSTVTVPDGEGGASSESADNPAWAALELLYNSDYGAGKAEGVLDVDAFSDWASYCDTNSYTVNIYIDVAMAFPKALQTIASLGRARIVQVGRIFTPIVDMAEEEPVQRFMFTVGNIEADSYSEEWLAVDDRANAIEVTFYDASNDYAATVVEVQSAYFDEADTRTTAVDLVGCTDRDMAIEYGTFLLNCNLQVTYTASWNADVDAIACQVGDIIEVSHDLPQFGYGGRVVSATADTVTLDREVTLETETTYVVRVKHADDTIEEGTVEAVLEETTTDELTMTAEWDATPALHDLYAFGEDGIATKLMRVVGITRAGDQRRKITAIEYVPAVYSDSGSVNTPESPSSLPMTDNIRATEVWKGGAETRASVTWSGFAILWHVWYRQSDDTVWLYAGHVTRPNIEIAGLDYGQEYTVAVSHTPNREDGDETTITLSGKTTAPGDVASISTTPVEDGVIFSWDAVTDFDLVGYKVRHGVHWEAATAYEIDDYVVPTDGTAQRFICTTAGTSHATTEPTWPESGTVNDGTAVWTEDTSNWDWIEIDGLTYRADLTAREREIQAGGVATMRAWAVGVDAFGNVSETAATGSSACLNYKLPITMGTGGMYDTIEAAIAHVGSSGVVQLKNGTYTLSAALSIPDVPLRIVGESMGGVIVKNAAGENGFVLHNRTEKFVLENLTIESQNSDPYSYMIYVYGDAAANNTSNCVFQNLAITCADNSTPGVGADGDYAIYCNKGLGKVKINNCQTSGGLRGISCALYDSVLITENTIDAPLYSGVTISTGGNKSVKINNNTITNIAQIGIEIAFAGTACEVSGNDISSVTTDACISVTGIYADRGLITGNEITINHASTTQYAIGIRLGCDSVTGNVVNGNVISIDLSSENTATGIYAVDAVGGSISGNTINVDNDDNTANHYGMKLNFDSVGSNNNAIQGNNINMVNADAKDIGIYIDANCNNNTGSGNVISNSGTDIDDNGTNNNINAVSGDVDGGTWT